jgi:3-oxoacyl-[acyl-carrier-protein] synthase III
VLELIIVATVTPDHAFPSTACLVQDALGAVNAAAFDLSAGCSGFVYGLSLAADLLKAGSYKYALVIGAETLSRIVTGLTAPLVFSLATEPGGSAGLRRAWGSWLRVRR